MNRELLMLVYAISREKIVDRDELAGRVVGHPVDEHAQQAAGTAFGVHQVVTQSGHGSFDGSLPVHQQRICEK